MGAKSGRYTGILLTETLRCIERGKDLPKVMGPVSDIMEIPSNILCRLSGVNIGGERWGSYVANPGHWLRKFQPLRPLRMSSLLDGSPFPSQVFAACDSVAGPPVGWAAGFILFSVTLGCHRFSHGAHN